MTATAPVLSSQVPWPLFDAFFDLPHPGSGSNGSPPLVVPGPSPPTNENISQLQSQIASFAFPEYEHQQQQGQQQLPFKYAHHAMQSPGFQQFTFTLQLQSGTRLHGHVRRYLPLMVSRYDVGRRPERALVLLTRAGGADLLYAALLKYVLLHRCAVIIFYY
jgi:hypothetical protein